MKAAEAIRLGLRANWQQFALLVAINAFVGGVVGVERSTLAPLAEHDFHLASRPPILSFLISFGLVNAASNFIAGRLPHAPRAPTPSRSPHCEVAPRRPLGSTSWQSARVAGPDDTLAGPSPWLCCRATGLGPARLALLARTARSQGGAARGPSAGTTRPRR